ncbi:hypothetical protein VA7868_00708 [Vibrio aerogenes CECT 7868]|uniref:TIGR03503 family protein n=1 Tax=Vibrio aerogenes CECT 7868 TaxID=1216006 RepID=A0A1M5WEV7_9VIBR|nr:TIGR03503 family protein [Vibrio aerogenes]SHH86031.1 hypothetical protein VA7868_00708 [Vibrio aerogenes CECT 7868]
MLRTLIIIVGLVVSLGSNAATKSSMSLLDNRFRVDPTISQINFVIYRSKPSRPVVLVRPDGVKYYSSRHPDNVQWYQEPAMDIVSIDNPMPGPWQAIGKVTPKNNVQLISNLKLTASKLPVRIFHNETIKFTARLTSDDKPLKLRDFLDRVKLRVTFTKYVENADKLLKEARPIPNVVGEFADDGRGLDEKAGDGVFTVKLNISPEPGKYRVRITSGNGVFLRAQEQEVLVYPTPYTTTFIQSRIAGQPHQIIFTGLAGTITPGSLVAHVEQENIYGDVYYAEGSTGEQGQTIKLMIPNSGALGNYKWDGEVYATDFASKRQLAFAVPLHTYSVVEELDLVKTRLLQEQAKQEQLRKEREAALLAHREKSRIMKMIYIGVGNVVVIIIGLIGWLLYRKHQAKKALQPKLQLNMPKK